MVDLPQPALAKRPKSIDTLQEEFGLFLTGDTRHQKIFLLVGPKRSGKGTIASVLDQLMGQTNVCGPTLSGLAQNFGLAPRSVSDWQSFPMRELAEGLTKPSLPNASFLSPGKIIKQSIASP